MSNDVVVLYEQNPSFDLIETGPGPGPPGATGLPGLVWRGAWNSGTAYIAGDAVSLAGSSYICILAHTNHTPPNATYWNVLASVGTNGTNGVPGLTWTGAWSSGTAYAVDDGVSLAGSSYICILAHTNHTPPNATYWNVLAAQGSTGATGQVGATWRGAWNSGTAYVASDVVGSGGSSYICILAHTNHTPPNATYWDVLAAQGSAGSAGAPGLNWTGAWSSGTAYTVDDGVSLAGSSYICILAHTNHTPPNAAYWDVLAAQGSAGTGGGNTTYSSAWASPPGSPTAGDLWLPPDSVYTLLRRNAGNTAWEPYAVGPCVDPTAPTWAWVNQGTASVDSSVGGICLTTPVGSGDNLRIRKYSAPGTPYTVTALIRPLLYASSYQYCGLILRESSSGKLATLQFTGGPQTIQIAKWSTATSFNGSYLDIGCTTIDQDWWLQISDDGTTRTYRLSRDGRHWSTLYSVGRTDFLTPDEIGFFCGVNGTSVDPHLTVLSWSVT